MLPSNLGHEAPLRHSIGISQIVTTMERVIPTPVRGWKSKANLRGHVIVRAFLLLAMPLYQMVCIAAHNQEYVCVKANLNPN